MLEITPERDNTLTLKFFSTHVNAPPGTAFVLWHAARPGQVASTPQPDDFAAHTVVRDPRQQTGCPSSGSTEYHRDVKAAYVQTIETLLAER